jgi:hypothetical protein
MAPRGVLAAAAADLRIDSGRSDTDMNSISRTVHGVLDYITGVLLGVSPWLFGFSDQHIAPEFAMASGGALVLYSFMTNYEVGVVRFIPFAIHRGFDLLMGFHLAGAPWFFKIEGVAGKVFCLLGILLLVVNVFTRRPREALSTH